MDNALAFSVEALMRGAMESSTSFRGLSLFLGLPFTAVIGGRADPPKSLSVGEMARFDIGPTRNQPYDARLNEPMRNLRLRPLRTVALSES